MGFSSFAAASRCSCCFANNERIISTLIRSSASFCFCLAVLYVPSRFCRSFFSRSFSFFRAFFFAILSSSSRILRSSSSFFSRSSSSIRRLSSSNLRRRSISAWIFKAVAESLGVASFLPFFFFPPSAGAAGVAGAASVPTAPSGVCASALATLAAGFFFLFFFFPPAAGA